MPGRASPPMPVSDVAAMGDQRVDQRAVGIARGRMDDEPGRLVDDDEILVLVDDVERDILALRRGGHGRRHLDTRKSSPGLTLILASLIVVRRTRDGAALDQALAGASGSYREAQRRGSGRAASPPARPRPSRGRSVHGGFAVSDIRDPARPQPPTPTDRSYRMLLAVVIMLGVLIVIARASRGARRLSNVGGHRAAPASQVFCPGAGAKIVEMQQRPAACILRVRSQRATRSTSSTPKTDIW